MTIPSRMAIGASTILLLHLAGCVNSTGDGAITEPVTVAGAAKAIQLAKERATLEGIDTLRYFVEAVNLREGAWWVQFALKEPTPRLGWPNHFTVRVTQAGDTYLSRGR